ncbi:uncharacterized protein L3040_001515 [Drepanopeziza brunnea f. sp. 'multigermtubi']|uniref:uncharacterized protein n=1 Tax=Drepanopeziza brunnea f. sp. 'multigermtubi' TaxID=698441 RepID=UPI00238C9CE9|nr:hypothetical protein L3040_001515 [Drepanopeziza brunnea f. sp. 'multigermtubi']
MIAYIPQPTSDASAESFRFLDLPGEIRNNIYGRILTVKPPRRGSETLPLKSQLSTQILRTCHFIRAEAGYVLRRTNLFVKFRSNLPSILSSVFRIRGNIQLWRLKPKHAEDFRASVVSYEITIPQSPHDRSMVFVLLHRDLEPFCSQLAEANQILLLHKVTVRDSYCSPDQESLLSERLQEQLIAPFRATFRKSIFEFEGVTQRLKLAAEQDITRPLPVDPESVFRHVRYLSAEGSSFFVRTGSPYCRHMLKRGNEYWDEALWKIQRVMKDEAYQSFREAGGAELLDRLTELSFRLNLNQAEEYRQCMRRSEGDQEALDGFESRVSHAVEDAMALIRNYPDRTWQPSTEQLGTLAYSRAVACRLRGDPSMLSQAEASIREALTLLPNDGSVWFERGQIALWRSFAEA